jgi:long-chain fatty acid transport protein
MAPRNRPKLIAFLLLAACCGKTGASGFQLTEQNVSGMGNAYAGSAAATDNASTIYFNPAGMTQLQDRELSVGVAAIGPSFRFHDQGSRVGAFSSAGDGGNAGGWAALPNGYLSWAVSPDVYVGVGFGAPFGLKTEYEQPWIGAAQSTLFEIKTYNVNPSLAYRVDERLALGVGVNWQRLEANYDRQAATTPTGSLIPLKLALDDAAWGWNAGALLTLSPTTKVGASYRSAIKYHTSGTLDVNNGGAGSVAASADLKLPDTFILSLAQQLGDRWELLGDVSWTGWSAIPKVDIVRSNGTLAQTLDTDFRDAWRVALGGNYQYSNAWKLKFGVAYDQTPVKDASTRLVSLPDNDRIWLSVGAQWAIDRTAKLDLGLAYIYIRDSKIDNDQSAPSYRGRVTGDYSGDIVVFGAQYSLAF